MGITEGGGNNGRQGVEGRGTPPCTMLAGTYQNTGCVSVSEVGRREGGGRQGMERRGTFAC